MGLDFSHCDAHWAYSGFNRFRQRLAQEVGLDLDRMAGFAENGRPWIKRGEPIDALLNHSDCEGELSPAQCAKIAPRLRELVARWPADDFDRQQAEELASGMEAAAARRQHLQFQ